MLSNFDIISTKISNFDGHMKKEVVLFPNSPDGIASVVLFLRAHPKGNFDMRITNVPAIVETLQGIKASEAEKIHILGVGVSDNLDDVTDALQVTHLSKQKIIWYCGRGYLDQYKEAIQSR